MPKPKDKVTDRVAAKSASLTNELAKATGVDVADVEKIMKKLGLDSALTHREYLEDAETRVRDSQSGLRLKNVSLASVHIAVNACM